MAGGVSGPADGEPPASAGGGGGARWPAHALFRRRGGKSLSAYRRDFPPPGPAALATLRVCSTGLPEFAHGGRAPKLSFDLPGGGGPLILDDAKALELALQVGGGYPRGAMQIGSCSGGGGGGKVYFKPLGGGAGGATCRNRARLR